jgi:hypothetical protein
VLNKYPQWPAVATCTICHEPHYGSHPAYCQACFNVYQVMRRHERCVTQALVAYVAASRRYAQNPLAYDRASFRLTAAMRAQAQALSKLQRRDPRRIPLIERRVRRNARGGW